MTSVQRHSAAVAAATHPAARLVAWARSWRSGLLSYDEVAPAVAGRVEHVVAGLPEQPGSVPLASALTALSRLGADELRLVLPAPGDPRGLPGPGEFTRAALVAGQGAIAGPLGFVPTVNTHTSGSGDTWETVCWRAFEVPPGRAEYISPSDAEVELTLALTGAADALTKLDVARWQPELAGALTALRRPGSGAELPPGFDPRSRRIYARAAMLERVLDLAERSAPGGAVTAAEAAQRSALLRPLRTACRRAVMAACNAPLEAF